VNIAVAVSQSGLWCTCERHRYPEQVYAEGKNALPNTSVILNTSKDSARNTIKQISKPDTTTAFNAKKEGVKVTEKYRANGEKNDRAR